MNLVSETGVAAELHALLDEEHDMLLGGKFDGFRDVEIRKNALLERYLSGSAPEHGSLSKIRKKAKQNQKLLASSIRAIRGVQGRLQAAQTQQSALDTYSPTGKRQKVGGSMNTNFERRS